MTDLPARTPPYRPIEDYGIIGNLSSVALVRLDGSIDWCCLPTLDSPSVFAAMLDADRGGYFAVRPAEFADSSQHYVEETNVLVTAFEAARGRIEVHDFMPTGDSVELAANSDGRPEIYREIRCTHGEVDVQIVWAPRHEYAGDTTTMSRTEAGWVAGGGRAPLGVTGIDSGRIVEATDGGPALLGRLSINEGDRRFLATTWDEPDPTLDPDEARDKYRRTVDAWTDWVGETSRSTHRPWADRWEDEIVRSELFLKLMAQRPSGALAAAPTTSLPETIRGIRNWDYRYTWIRDAAQVAQAFFALGHHDEADAFIEWSEYVACDHEDWSEEGLQVMYPLTDAGETDEQSLDHLEGYRESGPVRVGNEAFDQLQLDVYGELLNAVYERVRLGEGYDADLSPFLSRVVEEASQAWHHPDFGIWEFRDGPMHLVYSKIMVWVALNRACWLAGKGYLEGRDERWSRIMEQIRTQILNHGWDDDLESFVQTFEDPDGRLDATNLLIPMMEFLPADDPRVQSTIDRTLERLTVNDLVYRYRADDGLAGEEGTFVLCTCWLVDALAMSGRLEEAERIFDRLVDRTNHVGLLSEQIDPYSGEFLGNFPQAYSHVGLINSALYLATHRDRELPVDSLLGSRHTE